MVKIFTPVVNSPEFLNLQVSKFIENLDDFQIIAIDDSNDPLLEISWRLWISMKVTFIIFEY